MSLDMFFDDNNAANQNNHAAENPADASVLLLPQSNNNNNNNDNNNYWGDLNDFLSSADNNNTDNIDIINNHHQIIGTNNSGQSPNSEFQDLQPMLIGDRDPNWGRSFSFASSNSGGIGGETGAEMMTHNQRHQQQLQSADELADLFNDASALFYEDQQQNPQHGGSNGLGMGIKSGKNSSCSLGTPQIRISPQQSSVFSFPSISPATNKKTDDDDDDEIQDIFDTILKDSIVVDGDGDGDGTVDLENVEEAVVPVDDGESGVVVLVHDSNGVVADVQAAEQEDGPGDDDRVEQKTGGPQQQQQFKTENHLSLPTATKTILVGPAAAVNRQQPQQQKFITVNLNQADVVKQYKPQAFIRPHQSPISNGTGASSSRLLTTRTLLNSAANNLSSTLMMAPEQSSSQNHQPRGVRVIGNSNSGGGVSLISPRPSSRRPTPTIGGNRVIPPPASSSSSPRSASVLLNQQQMMDDQQQQSTIDEKRRKSISPSLSVKSSSTDAGGKWGNSNSKQAVYAREYRQKNKHQLDTMSERIHQLETENGDLRSRLTYMDKNEAELISEIQYLKGVLANEGPLAQIIGRLQPNALGLGGTRIQIPLSNDSTASSASAESEPEISMGNQTPHPPQQAGSTAQPKEAPVTRSASKRKLTDSPNEQQGDNNKRQTRIGSISSDLRNSSVGVCLHVQAGMINVEFCGKCNKRNSGQAQES